MLKAIIALAALLAAPGSVRADEGRSGDANRVEAAQINLFALPGPIYDEDGRLLAAPSPSDIRDAREILLRLPALPEARGSAGYEPGRAAPRRRGER